MAQRLAALIPHCTAQWYPGDGHLSIIIEHGKAILAAFRTPETS